MPLAACILAACLLLVAADSSARAKFKPPRAKPGSDSVELAEYVIRTPTDNLVVEAIDPFMDIEPKSLPPRLLGPYLARREELETIQRIEEGKKKPLVRRGGKDAKSAKCQVEEDDGRKARFLPGAGFKRIEAADIARIMEKTRCSQCELQEEFTLRVLLEKRSGSKGKKEWLFLLHERDPLWAVLGAKGRSSGGTNFFAVGGAPMCH